MLYAFTLGRNRELSIAELAAFFGEKKLDSLHGPHLFIKGNGELTQETLNRIGGTTKISQITGLHPAKKLTSHITSLITTHCNTDSKCIFAINIHPLSKNNESLLKSLLTQVKKELKKQEFKPRFINRMQGSSAKNIESIQSFKEILAKENTIEINLTEDSQGQYFASQLVASQDIESYALRDYEKPFRDAENGMLPPKLSQILINLSAGHHHNNSLEIYTPKETIIDPFCGSGGLLLEALLQGYNVVGSDINPNMVSDTNANIKWLIDTFHLSKKQDIRIFEHDAVQRFPKAKKEAIYATEGYLGPPLSFFPQPEVSSENMEIIENLYSNFFKNLSHIHDHTTVAICIPNYVGRHETVEPEDLLAQIESYGFTQIPMISRALAKKLNIRECMSFLYRREKQVVGRHVHVFQRKA